MLPATTSLVFVAIPRRTSARVGMRGGILAWAKERAMAWTMSILKHTSTIIWLTSTANGMHSEDGGRGTGEEEQVQRKRCFKPSINNFRSS